MQSPKNIEDFAGQRILAEDPRVEKTTRPCVACGASAGDKLGVKNELEIVSCRSCQTIYTPYSPWYSSQYFYLGYYLKAEEVDTPAFVKKRLEEITADFAPYRQTNKLLDIGCGAVCSSPRPCGSSWNYTLAANATMRINSGRC